MRNPRHRTALVRPGLPRPWPSLQRRRALDRSKIWRESRHCGHRMTTPTSCWITFSPSVRLAVVRWEAPRTDECRPSGHHRGQHAASEEARIGDSGQIRRPYGRDRRWLSAFRAWRSFGVGPKPGVGVTGREMGSIALSSVSWSFLTNYALAQAWARAMHFSQGKGRRLETGDCWIATTAVHRQIPLLTHDRDFLGLPIPGLQVISYLETG